MKQVGVAASGDDFRRVVAGMRVELGAVTGVDAVGAKADAQTDAQTEAAVAELAAIAVDGADSIGAAGREIAAVNILPWHTEIETAKEAYLLHNYAWQAYMQAAIEDPVAFTVDQPLVNQSFIDSQEPLEVAVPIPSLFDLELRVESIFVEGAPQVQGEIV